MHKPASRKSEARRSIPQVWANDPASEGEALGSFRKLCNGWGWKRKLKQDHWCEPATFLDTSTKINEHIHCGHKISNGAKIKYSKRCKTRHIIVKRRYF